MATVRQAAVDGAVALAGGVAVTQLAGFIPAQSNPYIQSALDFAVGAGVAVGGKMLKLSGSMGTALATGAMMKVYDRVLRRHLPPATVTTLLGEDRQYGLTPGGGVPGGYGQRAPGLQVYPQPRALPAGLSSFALYPQFDVNLEEG